jgi:adenosine kinase
MGIVLTGSIAFDYLMTFPGQFREHILVDQLDRLSVSFLVDSLIRRRGGIAANIAFTMGMLGERPSILATAGEDFAEYRTWLEAHGVDTQPVRVVPGEFTSSFFVTTDTTNAQIASFYTGAMAHASDLRLADLAQRPDLVVISANDPEAMDNFVKECQTLHLPYIYDPSQQIIRLDAKSLRRGLEGCTALFGNDYEFGMLQEKTGLSLESIRQQAGFIVMTLGEQGADILTADQRYHIPALTPAQIADPTGVGDAFRGGFFKGFLHQLDLETCGRMGVLAATYCLEHQGTQGHTFDLDGFLARYRTHFGEAPPRARLTG